MAKQLSYVFAQVYNHTYPEVYDVMNYVHAKTSRLLMVLIISRVQTVFIVI